MKINWTSLFANIAYLLVLIFVVHVIAVIANDDPDAIAGWFALGLAAGNVMDGIRK